jgi:hypothetical protein
MDLERRLNQYDFCDASHNRFLDAIGSLDDSRLIEICHVQVGGGGDYNELTLGTGAKFRQNIITDTVDPWCWNTRRARLLNIQIVNSEQFCTLTGGLQPPPSPISFQTCLQPGIPFFTAGDENEDVLAGCLDKIKPVPGAADLIKSAGAANDSQNQEHKKLGRRGKRKRNDDEGLKNPWFCHVCKKVLFSSAYR